MPVKITKTGEARHHFGPIYRLTPYIDNTWLTAGSDGIIALWQSIDASPTAFARTGEQVFALGVSPLLNELAIGTLPGHLHAIDTRSKAETHFIKYKKSAVYDLAYSDTFLLSAHANGEVALWNQDWQQNDIRTVSSSAIRCLLQGAWPGMYYAGDSAGAINTIGYADNRLHLIQKTPAHGYSVFCLLKLPHNQLLSGGRDGALCIWAIQAERLILEHKIPAHQATINHLVNLEPLPLWASASRDKTIKIWENRSGKLLRVIDFNKDKGHINSVNRLWWQAETKTLFSCSDDAAVMSWQIDFEL